VLRENVEHLKRIPEALLEFETIDGEDIDTVVSGGKIERRPPAGRAPPAVEAAKEKRPSILPPARSEGRTRKKPSRRAIARAIL